MNFSPISPIVKKIQDKFLEASEANILLDYMTVDKWKKAYEISDSVRPPLRRGRLLSRSPNLDLKERIIRVSKTYDYNNNVTTPPKTFSSVRDVYIQDENAGFCASSSGMMPSVNA